MCRSPWIASPEPLRDFAFTLHCRYPAVTRVILTPPSWEMRAMDIITQDEKAKLEARLAQLVADRPAISRRIAEARAMGDLKENAEYHAAREDQGLAEAEIRRLEERLKNAGVIDESARPDDIVFVGATVRLKEVDSGEIDTYRLVGESSGDQDDDVFEVTAASPMGEAMMKARQGEMIRVDTPRGVKRFEVVEIL